MTTYKMIVLDLDDTLLRDDYSISPRTKEALMRAQEAGVKVVLASGRPTYAMLPIAKELELAKYGSFILSFNGAKITNCQTDEVLFSSTLSVETIHEMYAISQREGIEILSYVGDDIITEARHNKYIHIESELTGMRIVEVESFTSYVQQPVVKGLMVADPDYLAVVEKKLQKELAGRLNVMRSKPFYLEVTEVGVDKGASLDHLIKQLGITKDEVIAIGDSYNDLSMIHFAGLGVAMGNAPDDIKAVAQYVTDTNMNDGVAKVVEKYIFDEVVVG
ncbi:Cof-type HAD-IIB family hydrolase [Paenibacillus sp. KN14-4R]|uniref:Cof-type HAD-IIB family hydrolase n=1 Tax=Paenibacillus sp. KN14-4R TaxID=3445773 RepID=UPI003F9F4D5D